MNPLDEVNTPDSELDKILRQFGHMVTQTNKMKTDDIGFVMGAVGADIAKAKTAVLAWRKKSLLALIGEDETKPTTHANKQMLEQEWLNRRVRNHLRAELRKAIDEPELAPDKSDVRTDDSGKDGSL